VFVDSVEKMATDVDKGGDTDHIIAGEVYEGLPHVLSDIAEMFFDNFFPPGHNADIVAHQHIKTAQFDHFLQAHNYHISFIYLKVKQFIQISGGDLIRIDDVAIP
jgi:hypothetical protein